MAGDKAPALRRKSKALADRATAAVGLALSARPGRDRKEPHFVRSYAEQTRRLLDSWGSREGALQAAIGSATPEEHELIGRLEKALLVYAGLRPDESVLDVGCGSGRLAVQLADWLVGQYLGTDVVQALLDHAAGACAKPAWRFERVNGLSVPALSDTFDMACAFSVFTHLRHEESYVYLQDIYRVLKPGGRLVFSYVEFRVPGHWQILEGNIQSIGNDAVLNQFMSSDAVEAFAQHLGYELLEAHRADEPFIPLPDDATGSAADPTLHSLGQSVAIYRKPVEKRR